MTVNRSGSRHGDEYVRYGTHRANAVGGIDYQNVGGTLHFVPGQSQATFTIPVIPHNWRGPSVHAAVYLYSSYPERLGPHNAKLFILHNAPVEARDPPIRSNCPACPTPPATCWPGPASTLTPTTPPLPRRLAVCTAGIRRRRV